jgi:hypothetical protein
VTLDLAASRLPSGLLVPRTIRRPPAHDECVTVERIPQDRGCIARPWSGASYEPVRPFFGVLPWAWPSGECGAALRVAGEFKLRAPWGAESYRLTLLPSFDLPTIIRIDHEKGQARVRKIERRRELTKVGRLTQEQWHSLLTTLERAKYWHLDNWDGRMGCDGEDWVLEGVRQGSYHVVARWSPWSADGQLSFYDACNLMLRLSRAATEPSP